MTGANLRPCSVNPLYYLTPLPLTLVTDQKAVTIRHAVNDGTGSIWPVPSLSLGSVEAQTDVQRK